jgi:hypothetical protein
MYSDNASTMQAQRTSITHTRCHKNAPLLIYKLRAAVDSTCTLVLRLRLRLIREHLFHIFSLGICEGFGKVD